MKKNIAGLAVIAGLSLLFTGVVPAAAWADDNYVVIKGNDDVRVTGEVTDVQTDSFTLNTGSTSVEVNMESLTFNNDMDELIVPGMKVMVEGSLSEGALSRPTILARTVTLRDEEGN
jgi:hypothetical protein